MRRRPTNRVDATSGVVRKNGIFNRAWNLMAVPNECLPILGHCANVTVWVGRLTRSNRGNYLLFIYIHGAIISYYFLTDFCETKFVKQKQSSFLFGSFLGPSLLDRGLEPSFRNSFTHLSLSFCLRAIEELVSPVTQSPWKLLFYFNFLSVHCGAIHRKRVVSGCG